MKRFLALALTLILAFSLSVPAMAASDDYWNGYYDGTAEGYDAGYADFEAGKPAAYPAGDNYDGGYDDGYVQGYISGYESAQWEHEIYNSPDYDRGYTDGYAAAMAGEVGYPDEYWENEAYEYGYDAGYADGIEAAGETVDGTLSVIDFGGTAGKTNVMLNGECIDFGDVWPENHNGRVMAPVRAVLEALGATVDYDLTTRTVTAELDGDLLIHQIGTDSVEVYAGGDTAVEPKIVTMDCTSLVSGGRTLVPVRFFSEALGFQVYWDSYDHAVVLIDPDYLDEVFGEDLTVVNLLLSNAAAQQKADTYYRQTSDLGLEVTVFDTLNGNTELGGSAKLDAIYGQEGLEAALKLDLRKLFDVLRKEYGNDADMRELASLLEQMELDFRFDAATEQLYIGGDLLGALTGLPSAWYQGDLSGSGAWTYGEELTVADLVLQAAMADPYSRPVLYVNSAIVDLARLAALLGDDQFTKSGSTYTLQAGALTEQLTRTLDNWFFMSVDDYYGISPTAELSLTITDKGNGTCSWTAGLHFRAEELELRLDGSGSSSQSSVTASLHVRNLFEAVFNADSTVQPTTTKPETIPADLDASLELEELPGFYM